MTAWTVQSTALAAVVIGTVFILRKRSASLREALLLVALAKFAIPPALVPVGSLVWESESLWRAAPAADSAISSGWMRIAALLYAGGASVVLLRALTSHLRLRRVLASASNVDGWLQARATTLAHTLGWTRAFTLQHTDRIAAPIASGIIDPRIVVPSRLLVSLEPAELDAVLLHEIAHHRRLHLPIGWMRLAVSAMWWWNPLVWMLSATLRHVQEEVCDDLVVAHGGVEAERYCEVLVHAATIAAAPEGSAAFAQAVHPLAHRVRRLLERGASAAPASQFWFVVIVASTIALPGAAKTMGQPGEIRAGIDAPPVVLEAPAVLTGPLSPTGKYTTPGKAPRR